MTISLKSIVKWGSATQSRQIISKVQEISEQDRNSSTELKGLEHFLQLKKAILMAYGTYHVISRR